MFLWYNHKPCPTAGTARIPCEVQPLHFLSHYLFRYPFRCLSHCPYHPFPTHLFKQKLMWKGLFVLPLRAYGDLNHLMPLPSVSSQPSMMALKNIPLLKKKQHCLFTLWFFTLIILFFLVLEFELQQRRDEGSAWTTTTMSLGPRSRKHKHIWRQLQAFLILLLSVSIFIFVFILISLLVLCPATYPQKPTRNRK